MVFRHFRIGTSVCFLGLVLFAPKSVFCHGVEHDVDEGPAVIITLHHRNEAPFSFEPYRITPAGKENPIQVGRTDGQGRVTFPKTHTGDFVLTAVSKDGHGKTVRFSVDRNLSLSCPSLRWPPVARLLTGIGIILGLFGAVQLGMRQKRIS